MPEPLSVLILENDPADFELVTHELARSGFVAQCQRAETESEYITQLKRHPDIILADYTLNGFDALRALELLQESGLVIPFIVLTGSVSEDTVVECMRRGAADYLLKDRMLRLGPAVARALDERELRIQKQDAEKALRQQNIELQNQYRRAESASRMKSAFLANMSHELRTPLTAVIGFAELLVDGKVGHIPPDQLDLLQDILGNAKHLLGLINDILDLARVEAGSMRFRPERVWGADVVKEIVTGLRILAMEKRIVLRTEIDLPDAPVLLDPKRLKQILFNYISNALKFTPADGVVTVRVRPEGVSAFRFEVADTGIGIAEHDIERLFQDFHQLDDGFNKQVQGTGLGLALTKRLVEAQGGSVGVTSIVGKGSTFYAILPFASASTDVDSSEDIQDVVVV